MDFTDRRVILGLGGALALVAAVGAALGIMASDDGPQPPPPAAQGGLVVQTGAPDDSLDSAKPLRCFVGGQFVGLATLDDCARKNGVAAGALDVGIDETGALAAAGASGPLITPLPPAVQAPPAPVADPSAAPTAECWRHAGEWRPLPSPMTQSACVQALFSGRCERPGSASYGRWSDLTLRLVPGKVEVSSDNRTFRTLVEQAPGGCAIPAF
jgi:hypothetical protein